MESESTSPKGKGRKGLVLSLISGAVLLLLVAVIVLSAWSAHRSRTEAQNRALVYPGITVEVLNAARVPRLAYRVTLELRRRGFDVLYYGNAAEELAQTVVVERAEPTMTNGKALASSIGCREVIFQPDPDGLVMVTLIVGKDFHRFFGKIEEKVEVY